MAASLPTHLPVRTRDEARREDWLLVGVLAGFAATFAMTVVFAVAYALAAALGGTTGGTLGRWFHNLADNRLTSATGDRLILAVALNLAVGLTLALVYARVVEPSLGGPGWRKAMLFALVPFALSVAVILPVMGGGFLGAALDAGPLPALGLLILHLVYGCVLGAIYGIALEVGLDGNLGERDAARRAERGAAVGVVAGLVLGLLAGFLVGPSLEATAGRNAVMLAGSLVGGGFGLLVGSLLALGHAAPEAVGPPNPAASRPIPPDR